MDFVVYGQQNCYFFIFLSMDNKKLFLMDFVVYGQIIGT